MDGVGFDEGLPQSHVMDETSLSLKESLSVEPDSMLILVHCDSHIEFKAHLDFPSC